MTTDQMLRDLDAHARIIARMVAEGVDRDDEILKIHVRAFVVLDSACSV